MELDDLFGSEAMEARNVAEVGAEFLAVTNRNFDGLGFGGAHFSGALFVFANGGFDFGVIDRAGVEGHEQGSVRGLQVAEPLRRLGLQRAQQVQNALVRGLADFFAEINEESLVAGRAESHVCSSELPEAG